MVLVFADGRYTERIKAGCLMAGQSVFMIEVSKGGQGGTPLPTTSLQTKGYIASDMLPSYRTMKYKSPIWGYFHVQKKQN